MKITKIRVTETFSFGFDLVTNAKYHGKFSDKTNEVDQIINCHLDALKVQLNKYIMDLPDKQG